MPLNPRAGRPRTRAVNWVRANHPATCGICGFPIDMDADRQRHPLASAIDEIVPVAHGGSTTDLANLRHTHRLCNGKRGVKPVTPQLVADCQAAVSSLLASHARATSHPW